MKLWLDGFGTHKWPSVERTRQFYQRALSLDFNLQQLDGLPAEDLASAPAAILSFYGRRYWEMRKHPECPLLFAMHGGPIIDHEFLAQHLNQLETTDVLIVNCASDFSILSKVFRNEMPKIWYLPLPVDTTIFRPRLREECREILPVEDVDYIIGFVGRLLPQRNLHQFLYMLAELRRHLSPSKVAGLVVGNFWVDYPVLNYMTEEYQGYIARLLSQLDLVDSVTYFPARFSDEELAMCYGAMDILIHPTNAIDENFGYVPVEAMACGTPVVGAAYGGLKDSILHGETGFLMPTWVTRSGIRMDLISGIEDTARLLEDRRLRKRISETAVRRVREFYTFEACASHLVSAVKTAIRESQAGGSRPVSMSQPRSMPDAAGLLPTIARPWEYYQNQVADYVSRATPVPDAGSRLRLAAPIEADGSGRYRLTDPAWPATYELDESALTLAKRCQNVVSVSDLKGGSDLALIKRLVDDGLLLASD